MLKCNNLHQLRLHLKKGMPKPVSNNTRYIQSHNSEETLMKNADIQNQTIQYMWKI